MEAEKFVSKIHKDEYLDYLYSAPSDDGKFPLVFYIHGAGSRGNDIDLLKRNTGLAEVIKKVEGKCIIAAPQCHESFWFDLFEVLTEFVDDMRHKDNVDERRVYVIGPSMGGYTTWQLIISHPDWFAAAIPICGGAMHWAAPRLKNLPIWAFHGALDNTVIPEESIRMVKAVNKNGGNAKITIFEHAEHNSWVPALEMEETWEWLLAQTKSEEQ